MDTKTLKKVNKKFASAQDLRLNKSVKNSKIGYIIIAIITIEDRI